MIFCNKIGWWEHSHTCSYTCLMKSAYGLSPNGIWPNVLVFLWHGGNTHTLTLSTVWKTFAGRSYFLHNLFDSPMENCSMVMCASVLVFLFMCVEIIRTITRYIIVETSYAMSISCKENIH